jgi:hypothetical protein
MGWHLLSPGYFTLIVVKQQTAWQTDVKFLARRRWLPPDDIRACRRRMVAKSKVNPVRVAGMEILFAIEPSYKTTAFVKICRHFMAHVSR